MAVLEHKVPNIVTENLHVRYTVATDSSSGPNGKLRNLTRVLPGKRSKTTVRALRGVNLVAQEGEMLGIVGANGSGKSTLLRNIAGVEQPDRGRVLVRYQPLLLGVNAALQPSLSGSENVRLGCLAMGLTPEEAAEAYQEVVALSALGTAIHRPMGTYSSGMGSRLRFAIALAARPRILLIDEALSTGDASFAERSERAMGDLLKEAGTVLLVNHAAKVIQELCDRAVWMHKGEVLMDGPAEAVAEKYRWWAWNVAKENDETAHQVLKDVVNSAVRDEINVLEPELLKNPIPRHAARKANRTHKPNPRHAIRRASALEEVEETSTPQLAAAESQVWKEDVAADFSAAEFPALPKPETSAVNAQPKVDVPPPLRWRPSDKQVLLRAENPNDRASSVASKRDLTGRRLASRPSKNSTQDPE